MRNRGLPLVLLLLFAAAGLGQNASVNVRANADSCKDCRPFGKYLAEICTIYGDNGTLASQRKVSCAELPYPGALPANPQVSAIRPKDQTITIKLVCDPAQKTACDPPNPKIGSDFFVSATADSGSPVQQTILQGNVTPLGGARTVEYRTNGPGPIIIRATVQATPIYTAAPPVDLILQASADASASDSCPVLPISTATATPLDAPTIVSLLGNPTPFILVAQGPNSIAIYSTREQLKITPTVNERAILHSFEDAIATLAGRTAGSLGITPAPAKPFSVELRIPHGSALGDLATRIGGLNYSQFTLADVGRGWVRVTAPTQPDCDTWKGFLTDIREVAWQLVSVPTSEKLFYLSSSDVATAFSGLASPGGGSGAGGGSSSSAASATTAPSAGSTPSAASGGASSPSGSGGSGSSAAGSPPAASAAPSASSSNATIAITQPPGSDIQINSDSTPCVVAGLTFGNPTACGAAPATPGQSASAAPAAAAVTPAPPAPLTMASVAVAAGTGEQTPPDLLIYSDTNPGDDAQIEERNRIIAQLDLPRPEMILSAWVTQNSTANPQAMGAFNNMVKQIVANYNDEYERVVLNGWLSLKRQQADDPGFFNESFRSYITDRFVADTNMKNNPGATVQEVSQAFLDQSQAKMADPVPPVRRTNLGICEHHRYCLGYTGLFRRGLSAGLQDPDDPDADNPSPIRPTLTDLLLAIIAAQQPVAVALHAIEDVEGDAKPVPPCGDCICDSEAWYLEESREAKIECKRDVGHCGKENIDWRIKEKVAEVRKRCHAIWRNLDLDHVSPPPQPASCEELDFRGVLGSLLDVATHEPRLHLQCFKEAAEALLVTRTCKPGDRECNKLEENQTQSLLALCADKNCKGSQEPVESWEGEDAETLVAIGTEEQLKRREKGLTETLLRLAICRSEDEICQRAKAELDGQKIEKLNGGGCKPGDDICKLSEDQLENSMTETLVRRANCGPGPTKTDCETAVVQLRRLKLTLADRTSPPYKAGLFRAAIADFLFNYKMSQQYPHEFVPYDLTQSANTLNNALSPLIDAFNRDLWSYQMFVRADMQYQVEKLNSRTDERCCVKKLFGLDKPSFFNDGVVTVRTISGQPTNVSVTSQSFLNGSTAPELSALLSSLSASGGTGAGSSSSGTSGGSSSGSGSTSSGVPPALGGTFGIVASALANYQTSFAQIGRQLSFTATPRSLATASSAEIAVTLNADESAGGPLYTGPGATDPAFNTSRVANHDTTTRVRVDSIKLFEVSSFSAIVERSRSRFPLLPPFVEIPYIGTLAGIPLGSAKEFHSSTAIISAYVIPTAADIAYGLHFVSDLMVDGLNPGPCSFFKGAAGPDVKEPCIFRKMFSLHDVGVQQPIREFNKNITRCFATDTSSDGCSRRVSFDNTLESK
jgi:hypothetical protein